MTGPEAQRLESEVPITAITRRSHCVAGEPYGPLVDARKVSAGDIRIELSYAEAVVLAEMLWRWERDGTQGGLPFTDQAEQRLIWDLTASFEPLIGELFDKDRYDVVVAHSRWQVRDSNDR